MRKSSRTGATTPCVGEDSTTYLASPKAPKRIAQLIPDAKIIVMLRDPVMRAYSHYWHLVESRRAVYNFEETLQYQPENVISRGYYQAQIERYHQHFPAEQIKIIIFEHFIKNQQAVIDDVCAFLGLDGSVDTDSVPTWSNKTTVPRVLSLQLLYNRLLRPITNKRFFIRKDLPGGDNRTSDSAGVSSGTSGLMTQLAKVDRFIVDLNAGKRPPIRPETRDFLQAHYAHENRDLSELIGAMWASTGLICRRRTHKWARRGQF